MIKKIGKAEYDYRKDDAKRVLNLLGGPPTIDVLRQSKPSEEEIEAVTLRGMIVDVINYYCADKDNGWFHVQCLVDKLPKGKCPNEDAFLAHEILQHTIQAMRILTSCEDVTPSLPQDLASSMSDQEKSQPIYAFTEDRCAEMSSSELAFYINKGTLVRSIMTHCGESQMEALFYPESGIQRDQIRLTIEEVRKRLKLVDFERDV